MTLAGLAWLLIWCGLFNQCGKKVQIIGGFSAMSYLMGIIFYPPILRMFDWYLTVLRQYAQFSGRARRSEYWFFVLFNGLISMACSLMDWMFGLVSEESGVGLFGGLYGLAMLIPGLSVGVRRLHDTGRSGWWLLIALIPLIGGIVLLVFMVQEGTSGDNAYGPDPKASNEDVFGHLVP